MGAVRLLAARDLRRRWARLLVLAVVVGVTGAVALAFAAGARRSGTALHRFRDAGRSADVEIQAAPPTPAQLEALETAHGVEAIEVNRSLGVLIPAAPDFVGTVLPSTGDAEEAVDRGRLVAGRRADPDVVDEVVVGEGIAGRLGLRVGDHLPIVTLTPSQVDAVLGGTYDVGEPAGPADDLTVVGVVRSPLDLGDSRATAGLVILTPAFGRAYDGQIGEFGARIRIRATHGEQGVPEVIDVARTVFGPELFSAQGLALGTQGAANAIDLVAVASWVVAALVAILGGAVVVVLLSRETTVAASEHTALRPIGCTRWQRTAVFLPASLLVAGSGAVVAGAGAVLLSPRFPFGVARRADPDVGLHADWVVLLVGGAALVAAVLVVGLASAHRASRSDATRAARRADVRPSLSTRLARLGAAPWVSSGFRLALEPGRGSTATAPVRSSLVGVAVGLTGVVAVAVFAANLGTLLGTPAEYGSDWDLTVTDVSNNTPCGGPDAGISEVAGVASLAEVCVQNVQLGGQPVSALAISSLRGASLGPGIVAGRAPVGDDEVALGGRTMEHLGLHIGDEVPVGGRTEERTYTVVGQAVFPTVVQSQPMAEGAWFTTAGYEPLFDPNLYQRAFLLRLAPDAEPPEVERQLAGLPDVGAPTPPITPVEVDRLDQVRWVPWALVVLFGGLGVLALLQSLLVSVLRRGHEVALLKALGFEGRQLRGAVLTSAVVAVVIGLLVAVPLGIAVGVAVWRWLATDLGVATVAAVPVGWLAVLALTGLVVAALTAWLPGRLAARRPAGPALRAD